VMKTVRCLSRCLGGGVLATLLSGCVCYLHPVAKQTPEVLAPCQSVTLAAKDHVYVFLIHGMDPLNYANLSGLRDYIQGLGFHKTYYGQLSHTPHFTREI